MGLIAQFRDKIDNAHPEKEQILRELEELENEGNEKVEEYKELIKAIITNAKLNNEFPVKKEGEIRNSVHCIDKDMAINDLKANLKDSINNFIDGNWKDGLKDLIGGLAESLCDILGQAEGTGRKTEDHKIYFDGLGFKRLDYILYYRGVTSSSLYKVVATMAASVVITSEVSVHDTDQEDMVNYIGQYIDSEYKEKGIQLDDIERLKKVTDLRKAWEEAIGYIPSKK